ncbi:MAG: AMP-dependent synthetase/ligase, partial [Desulforhopalus sp.]
ATGKAMADGWFKTGDIARIDGEGFVYIVDRKKELIVTSGGKNIAPQPIENELRLDKYISQALIYGDRKPYLVALLTPNIERVINLAREEKIPYIEIAELINHTRIREVFASALARLNRNLPPYQTIKNFAVVPREFSVEEGELTPTLKMKRKVIYQKYQAIIENLYHSKGNAEIARDKPEYGEKNVPN